MTEDEYAEFLNREDELNHEELMGGGSVTHEVIVRFRWTEDKWTTDGVAEELDDIAHNDDHHDVIGRAIDAFLDLAIVQEGEARHDPTCHNGRDQLLFDVLKKTSSIKYFDE